MTLTGMTTVATATIVEAVAGRMATYGCAWRGEAKRGGAGAAGCEDGEEGGEAARSGTITEQAASVVALHCVAAGYVGSGDGGET